MCSCRRWRCWLGPVSILSGGILSHSDVSLTGNDSAGVTGEYGSPLQDQANSAGGGRLPFQGSRLASGEGVAISGNAKGVSLAVRRDDGGHGGDSEGGKEAHYG